MPDAYQPLTAEQGAPDVMSAAVAEPEAGASSGKEPKPNVSPEQRKVYDEFRSRIDACKVYRRKLIATWITNIDMRRGKPFASQTDEDRINVNLDWSLTKTKQASLFSQVPKVRIDHPPQSTEAGPWLYSFETKVNDYMQTAGIESVMDECLPDVINAAGIGALLVSYETLTEDVQVPKNDLSQLPPEIHSQVLQSGQMPDGSPVEMMTVPRTLDSRYLLSRISPADLLWPLYFYGSDWDQSPWIGRTGRTSWPNAKKSFGLTDEDKDRVMGEDKTPMDRLTYDIDKNKLFADEMVSFDEIFYKEYHYYEGVKSYDSIRRLVFVTGKTDPVIDEQWKGQEWQDAPDGGPQKLIGARRYPIRVLTLTYISDEAIPPSDSAIGRPQVQEINKARTQMIQQRERSLPVRWFDVNRVDPLIQTSLMRGTWQAMIPVQGQGNTIIGEIAKANMPQENFAFDRIAKADLMEAWTVGQAESGQGVETSGEAKAIMATTQTRQGRERALVGKFFCLTAEVLGGLVALYEPPESFGEGYDPAVISKALTYSILADSTVLLDSNQRLKKLVDFVNFAGKSGWVNIEPVMKEIATLSGLDPKATIKAPQPKPPVEPNISLRLTGVEDLMNPLTLAFLMKSGQAPPQELIEQAKQLIASAVTPTPPPAPPMMGPDGQPMPPGPGGPGGPEGPAGPGGPPPPGAPPIQNGMLPPGTPPGPPPPMPPPPSLGEANPKWTTLPKLNKRTEGKS